jgi:hypothetical protein
MIPSLLPFARYRKLKEYQPISDNGQTPLFRFHGTNGATHCRVWHLLYEPMTVLVVFDDGNIRENGHIEIFPQPQKRSAMIEVELLGTVNSNNQMLAFYKVLHADLALTNWQQWYLKRIFGHSIRKGANFMAVYNFDIYRKLVALFSFPKQVRLVSMQIQGDAVHFPIDLCAVLDTIAVIGVRNSNRNMGQLQTGDTFYLGNAAAADYRQIYALGKFNDGDNQKERIDVGDFEIPAVVSGYRKLTLQQKLPFENQTIYIASVASAVDLNDKENLFHIHKIWMAKNLKYTTVA